MIFKHAVPILYSSDITRSLTYYTEVLGFENKWDWDNPPNFGGVSKNSVEVFFCLNNMGSPGTWFSIMVDDVDEYYETVKAKGAKILSEPGNMEWGLREMIVEDPDGHRIRIGAGYLSDRKHTETTLPSTIKIVARMPTAEENYKLCTALGFSSPGGEMKEVSSFGIEHAVVAEDTATGEVVGTAFVYGDQSGFYYIRNVFVNPAWQGKRVGSAMMLALTDWMEKNAPSHASAWLHTGERLSNFYKQFGFVPVFGMFREFK